MAWRNFRPSAMSEWVASHPLVQGVLCRAAGLRLCRASSLNKDLFLSSANSFRHTCARSCAPLVFVCVCVCAGCGGRSRLGNAFVSAAVRCLATRQESRWAKRCLGLLLRWSGRSKQRTACRRNGISPASPFVAALRPLGLQACCEAFNRDLRFGCQPPQTAGQTTLVCTVW